jgi:hypothetical protein
VTIDTDHFREKIAALNCEQMGDQSEWDAHGREVHNMVCSLCDEIDRMGRNIHTAMQAARGEEKEECARMVREHARAISKGSFPKPRSAEEWGEVLAKHIEIPF